MKVQRNFPFTNITKVQGIPCRFVNSFSVIFLCPATSYSYKGTIMQCHPFCTISRTYKTYFDHTNSNSNRLILQYLTNYRNPYQMRIVIVRLEMNYNLDKQKMSLRLTFQGIGLIYSKVLLQHGSLSFKSLKESTFSIGPQFVLIKLSPRGLLTMFCLVISS